jgi:hypothetical protein
VCRILPFEKEPESGCSVILDLLSSEHHALQLLLVRICLEAISAVVKLCHFEDFKVYL